MSIADVIAVMSAGKIEDVGPPARVYLKPSTRFTAAFMGENNMVAGKVRPASDGGAHVDTPWGPVRIPGIAPASLEVHLSVRPEQIAVGSPPGGSAVSLGTFEAEEITFYGTHLRCQGRQLPSNLPLIVRLPQNQTLSAGAQVPVWAAAEDIVLLER